MLYEGIGVGYMKDYILSVIAAAVICAVAQGLLGRKNATGRILYLISGIFMAVTVCSPLGNIKFSGIADYWDGLSVDAQQYVSDGTVMAENQMCDIIKEQSEAYILDKANRMGLQIAVEVELDGNNDNIPCGVVLSGNASPYTREQLESYIADTLGIPKENQKWK